MKLLKTINKICISCMEKHNVEIVEDEETGCVNGRTINFIGIYQYCNHTGELIETPDMIKYNHAAAEMQYYRNKILGGTNERV